jgi:hypothetical protein
MKMFSEHVTVGTVGTLAPLSVPEVPPVTAKQNISARGGGDIVERLLAYWRRQYGMVQGSRNSNLLILAQWMNEHGVPLNDALAVCLPMQDPSGSDPFTADEIQRTVQHGYRRTVAGSNPWITSKAPQPPPQAHPYRMQAGFTLSPSERAAMVAMFRKAIQAEVTAPGGEGDVHPQAPVAPAAPAPVPAPPAPTAAHLFDLATAHPHLHPYTLALELYVRTGVELTGATVARLLSSPRQGRTATPQT